MAKKDKKSSRLVFLKKMTFLILGAILVYFFYYRTDDWMRTSALFKIREIYCDPSLEFLKSSPLLSLKGKNLYTLDLKAVQRRLKAQYPEISSLRLLKRYPDRLLVVVERRVAHARLAFKNHQVIVDDQGSILALGGHVPDLPLISGLNFSRLEPQVGATVKGQDFKLALKILKEFATHPELNQFKITRLKIDSQSEILLFILSRHPDKGFGRFAGPRESRQRWGDLKIIIDAENIPDKINMLSMVLAQARNEMGGVKYIDLRFKEAVLGKKSSE